jgi:hypothetical protein
MSMAKKAATKAQYVPTWPMGPVILANLYRLGYADVRPRATKLSELVTEAGGSMSNKRISAIVNAARVEPQTVAWLAKAIGVKPAELLREVEVVAQAKRK